VSAAYYALFHFLTSEATQHFVGVVQARKAIRHLLARAFEHGEMKAACEEISKLARSAKPYRGFAIPNEIQVIAETLVDTQGKRHRADYDLSARHTRQEAQAIISRVRRAIGLWPQVPDDDRLWFLVPLLTHRKISRR
jgi:hypothetical protein